MSRDSSPGVLESDQEVAQVLAQGETRLQRQRNERSQSTPGQSGRSREEYSPFRPATVLSNTPRNNTATVTPTFTKIHSMHESAGRGEVSKLQEYISQDTNINERDTYGLTPLMWAAANDQPDSTQFLLEHGAEVDARAGEERMHVTSLHLAASAGSTAVMMALLEKSRSSINTRTLDGNTPLLYAVYKDRRECVSILLEHGADLTIANNQGYAATQLAWAMGYYEIEKMINQYVLSKLDVAMFGSVTL